MRDEAGSPITRDRPIRLAFARAAALFAALIPFLNGCSTIGKRAMPMGAIRPQQPGTQSATQLPSPLTVVGSGELLGSLGPTESTKNPPAGTDGVSFNLLGEPVYPRH